MIWTPEKVAILRAGITAGETYGRLTKMIGTTRSAIAGKVRRLGLSNRHPEMGYNRGKKYPAFAPRIKEVSSGLNEKAIVLLLAESSGVSRTDVRKVLGALEQLRADYTTLKP